MIMILLTRKQRRLFIAVTAFGMISLLSINFFRSVTSLKVGIIRDSLCFGASGNGRMVALHRPTSKPQTTMPLKATEPPCRETSNFVFVKTHKTGSTTLRSLTTRFGFFRNLSFLLGKGGIIGHLNTISLKMKGNDSNFLPPIGVRVGDYENYRNYNISNIHVYFDKRKLDKLMYPSPDLKYITILREPTEQWLSNFQYYKGYKRAGLTLDTIATELLPLLRSNRSTTLSFNRQSRDLGVRAKALQNETLNETLAKLDRLFNLVLITEYFDESLLVMKKMFCWSFGDILYVKKRAQPNPFVVDNVTRDELRRRSWADVVLYEHFLKVLWEKVRDYGPNFEGDLQLFRKLLNDSLDTCVEKSVAEKSADHYLYIEAYRSANSSAFCWAFVNTKFHMDIEVVKRQGRETDKRWGKLAY